MDIRRLISIEQHTFLATGGDDAWDSRNPHRIYHGCVTIAPGTNILDSLM